MFEKWGKYIVEAADLLDLYHLEDGQEVSEKVVEVIKGNALWEEWRAIVEVAIELKKMDIGRHEFRQNKRYKLQNGGTYQELLHFPEENEQ